MIEAKLYGGPMDGSAARILQVKGCFPHYRRSLAEIMRCRKHIREALVERGVSLPISHDVHLHVLVRRHTDGGDLMNFVMAVSQALDGNTLDRANAPLIDDKQIISIRARWIP